MRTEYKTILAEVAMIQDIAGVIGDRIVELAQYERHGDVEEAWCIQDMNQILDRINMITESQRSIRAATKCLRRKLMDNGT